MAHVVTNAGIHHMLTNDMSSADIRLAVFTSAVGLPAAATVKDWNTLADATGTLTEAAVGEYARQDLANVTVTEVDGSDNVTITADDITINGVSAGETWATMVYYIQNTGDTGIILSCDEIAAAVPTNGGNITLPGPSYTIAQP